MRTFKRGIHPHDKKIFAADKPITPILATGDMIYPLSQHIGAPAIPLVAVGDRVLAGQKIAEGQGVVSAPIHSAVSGVVSAITYHVTSVGENQNCIVIKNDDKDEWVDDALRPVTPDQDSLHTTAIWDTYPLESFTPAIIRQRIREAGIVGLGGAGFPAVVKLTPKDDNAIEYVLINGAECEPYLTSDDRLMRERGQGLIRGCQLLLRLFPHAKCLIGIEDNKPEAIAHLKDITAQVDRVEVCPLKAKYPQGGERMLVYALTGRKLNSKCLPAERGCVVVNVATTIAIFDAVVLGKPMTHRVMTITGDGVANPCNLQVPVGMSYANVLAAAGGFAHGVTPQKVITGGPMMGFSVFTLDISVSKTSASILAMKQDQVAMNDTTACIRCGRCVSACPEGLLPLRLSEAADHNDFETFEKYGGMECIECGSCAFVCPAKRYLVQSMRYGRRKTSAIIRERVQQGGGK